MIGAKQIEIDAKQFTAGMTTSDYTNDGGFGSSSFGINPIVVPGVIHAVASESSVGTLSGNFIASCEDSQASSAKNRLFVDDVANYYWWDGTTLTKKHTGTATAQYIFGKTDMVSFNLNTYTTLGNDMSLWNTSADTFTESWWVGTKSKSALDSTVPHPLLVFENFLWVADGANLHSIDSSQTISTNVLSLNGSERIYALGIDPVTGLMLISVQQTVNISDTLTSKFFVYFYDGYSSKPRRKIQVDDLVTAFHSTGGAVFVGYGPKLGQWTGQGIQFLRSLSNATYFSGDLPYKHHFANVGNVLYVIDGGYVLAYGEIQQRSQKVFWYPYKQSSHLSLLCDMGSSKLGIGYSTNTFVTVNMSSLSQGVASFYTNNVNFPRPVKIQRMRVITTGISATNSSGIGGAVIIDEKVFSHAPQISTFVNTTGTTKYVFDFEFGATVMQTIQPRINIDTQNFGIVRIIIYYDVYE